jgi:hypothetical protein
LKKTQKFIIKMSFGQDSGNDKSSSGFGFSSSSFGSNFTFGAPDSGSNNDQQSGFTFGASDGFGSNTSNTGGFATGGFSFGGDSTLSSTNNNNTDTTSAPTSTFTSTTKTTQSAPESQIFSGPVNFNSIQQMEDATTSTTNSWFGEKTPLSDTLFNQEPTSKTSFSSFTSASPAIPNNTFQSSFAAFGDSKFPSTQFSSISQPSQQQHTTFQITPQAEDDYMHEEEEEEQVSDSDEVVPQTSAYFNRKPHVLFTFGVGNQIAVFKNGPPQQTATDKTDTIQPDNVVLQDPFESRWLVETTQVFNNLQDHYRKSLSLRAERRSNVDILSQYNAWRKAIFDSSQMYRAYLTGRYQHHETTVNLMELQILHLIEILEVHSIQSFSGHLSVHLVSWIQRAIFDRPDQNSKNEIIRFVLQGLQDEAVSLLEKEYSALSNNDLFKRTIELILQKPQLDRQVKDTFIALFQRWQSDVHTTLREAKNRNVDSTIVIILQIMSGDFSQIEDQFSWFDLLSASILYRYPTVTKYELPGIVNDLISTDEFSKDESNMTSYDRVLFHFTTATYMLLTGSDMIKIFRHLSFIFSAWWSAHTVDLVWHCRQVALIDQVHYDKSSVELTNLRDSLLTIYGNSIMVHSTSLPFSKYYFSNCTQRAADLTSLCLEQTSLESESSCIKVVSDAHAHGLFEVARNAHSVMGMNYIKRYGNYAAGIRHLVIAKDRQRIESVISTALRQYVSETSIEDILNNGSFGNLEILQSVGTARGIQSNELQLIDAFLEYVHSKQTSHLIKLLNWPYISKAFYLLVLAHSIYHMATGNNKTGNTFKYDDVVNMIQGLENICVSHRQLPVLDDKMNGDCITAMRLVLSEQLAKLVFTA